jgi:diaminohydroxyphosphoribosylaminopyrimidine deaminase/5-amino-6-(5-phosphoribosylamino)uracil reductase
LRTPAHAKVLSADGDTVIFCIRDDRRKELEAAGAQVEVMPAQDGRVDIRAVLENLAQRQVNDVLVEAGPTLAGSMLEAGVVDELVIYQAPHIMGSNTHGMFSTPAWSALGQRMALKILDTRQIGPDIRITARPAI